MDLRYQVMGPSGYFEDGTYGDVDKLRRVFPLCPTGSTVFVQDVTGGDYSRPQRQVTAAELGALNLLPAGGVTPPRDEGFDLYPDLD